jgi:hypothetical protein
MRKVTHGAARARFGFAAIALALLTTPACDDDSTGPFPSRNPAVDMEIFTIPANSPFLVLRDQSLRLLAVPTDAAGMWVDAPITWSSSNSNVATVSSDGVLTAVGNVNPSNVDTITVTATGGGQTVTQSVIIRRFPAVASVAVSNLTPFLAAGQTVQLTGTARDAAGVTIAGRDLQWASSAPAVASVSQTGLVTAHSSGTANITATAIEEGEPIVGTRVVTVPAVLTPGSIVAPNISEGSYGQYVIMVPAGTAQLVVQISGGTGDTDMYLYAPNTIPGAASNVDAGSGFTCRPWAFGSEETCTVNNPAPGAWGLRLLAYQGDGLVSGLSVTVTLN